MGKMYVLQPGYGLNGPNAAVLALAVVACKVASLNLPLVAGRMSLTLTIQRISLGRDAERRSRPEAARGSQPRAEEMVQATDQNARCPLPRKCGV